MQPYPTLGGRAISSSSTLSLPIFALGFQTCQVVGCLTVASWIRVQWCLRRCGPRTLLPIDDSTLKRGSCRCPSFLKTNTGDSAFLLGRRLMVSAVFFRFFETQMSSPRWVKRRLHISGLSWVRPWLACGHLLNSNSVNISGLVIRISNGKSKFVTTRAGAIPSTWLGSLVRSGEQ